MRHIKSISWFLGISMFTFGILKFVDPFKGWYTEQIYNSKLGDISYAMGIAGEIAVGAILILSLLFRNSISPRLFAFLVIAASAMVVAMMATGMYVHFHPDVPAEVLPLKIKPPYIPGLFLILAILNVYFVLHKSKHSSPGALTQGLS